MPVYEYEPVDWDCAICKNRLECLQGVNDAPHTHCPTCGLEVRRIVSRAQMKVRAPMHRSAEKGLTTFRKVEKGKWERVSGEGVDMIVGTQEDMQRVEEESKPRKVYDVST